MKKRSVALIRPPRQVIRKWIPDDNARREPCLSDQRRESRKSVELPREEDTILFLNDK